jgi:hypothetical protein
MPMNPQDAKAAPGLRRSHHASNIRNTTTGQKGRRTMKARLAKRLVD